ncbi:Laminin subunit [Dirofilaria immitis]
MRPHWLLLRLDCSRVECRIPLANSLEAEKTVLMTRNNELESRLIQLGKNISAASITARSTVTVTPDAIEAISNSMSSENTFKPVHTRVMLQMEGANERQTSSTEALQQSVQKNLANARGYYEKKLINSMRTELNAVHEEYSLVQEKIIQMGCVNFELEDQLKNAKEKLRNAEVRVQQAEEQAEEARQNCVRQKKYWESLQFEFLAKLSIAEKEISDLKEELDLKNEQLKARTIQNNKRNEELKQWRFAIDEIEAVHTQIKMLEKQVNNGQKEGDITQAIIDVTTENDQLRKTIQEMEKCAIESQNHEIQLQIQLDEIQRDSQNQILKVRASMQGKIRDLEDRITAMNTEQTDKVEHLNVSIETLRADREWILEENARLLKLLGSYKEKLNDTWEALDTRQEESKKLRSKLDDDRALIVQLADDLEEAQQMANILLEQKISVLDDVGRLKEALEAQDQYIELLEKDTKIYEEHVGLLRDSLGASKAERRALIRAKAYETKLKALEQEKEQMNRRSNGKLNFLCY